MNSKNENIHRIIVGFLTNDISDEDLLVLNNWKNTSIQNQEEFEHIKYLWEKSQQLKMFKSVDVEGDLEKVKRSLSFTNQLPRVGKKVNLFGVFRKVAAIILPLLFISSMGYLYWNVPGFGRLAAFKTSNKIEKITLPDSSVVILNKNSKIIYNKSIAKQELRNIDLKGEAFFKVVHNNTPFVVSVKNTKVSVLGTEFNVNQLSDKVFVSVVRGKVGVEAYKQKVELTKGERAVVTNGKVQEDKALFNELYWNSGVLKFEQATLNEICNDLRKAFPEIKKVIIEGKQVATKVTTTFENQSLNEILEELEIHFNKKITFNDSVLTISD